MKKILVATDSSETAGRAIMEAKRLAECIGANVTIIYVAEKLATQTYSMAREYVNMINEDVKNFGEKLLEDSLKKFENFPGEVDTVIKSGDAGREIIKEAEDGGYDLVVMGST